MTDNGSAYRSHAHRAACTLLGLRHSRTKPRRPRTDGKAERFIQTLLNGWAYARLYSSSTERALASPSGSTSTSTSDHTAASAANLPAPD